MTLHEKSITESVRAPYEGELRRLPDGSWEIWLLSPERDVSGAKPQIAGKDAALGEAVQAAAKLLAKSRQPILGGLGTEVNGMRAVMTLAEKA